MAKFDAEQQLQAALQHHHAGRFAQAEKMYRQILSVNPRHAGALHLLGAMALQFQKNEAAIEFIRQAVAIEPRVAVYQTNLGSALMTQLDGLEEAIECYTRAAALEPTLPESHYNLALALLRSTKHDKAIEALHRALRLRKDWPDAQLNLAIALDRADQLEAALDAASKFLSLRPGSADAFKLIGNVRTKQGDIDQALHFYRKSIQADPKAVETHSILVNLLYYHPTQDGPSILAEHRQWDRVHALCYAQQAKPHSNEPSPNRRLKIGYVSPDYRDHPASRFLMPLLANHDRNQYEVICFSDVRVADEITHRYKAAADQWHTLVGKNDDQAAELIRNLNVDILVDLALHSANNRLLTFARKPAPVQVTWLGYVGTTGLSAMDYRISDPYLDPPGSEADYSEKTVRLDHCYWCYEPDDEGVTPAKMPAAENGFVTFGCFNNAVKTNSFTLQAWARILQQTPGSRMILHAYPGKHRDCFLDIFARADVDRSRVEFVPVQSRKLYFQKYQQIDIALDPFPYCGGTTTCDALWMNVPVVTLTGKTGVSRAGATLLTNVGLPELIAGSVDEYVSIAVGLAADLSTLLNIRQSLREKMVQSPLLNGKQFAREMETAFRWMWQQWCDIPR